MHDQKLLYQAMQVKKVLVGMFHLGVISSNANVEDVMKLDSDESYNLSKLLEYSDITRKHSKVERLSLSTLPTKPVVSEEQADVWGMDADLVFFSDQHGDFFQLSHKVMSHSLFYSREEAHTSLYIRRFSKWSERIWEVHYGCVVHKWNRGDNDKWSGSMVFPERDMLLNFMFSPIQLTHVQIMDYMGGSENFKEHTHFCSEFIWNGFRHIQFWYEGVRLGKIYAELKDHPNTMKEGRALVERGDIRFSIVEIGTVMIGDIKHWIYTGSEHIEKLISIKLS